MTTALCGEDADCTQSKQSTGGGDRARGEQSTKEIKRGREKKSAKNGRDGLGVEAEERDREYWIW